MYRSIELSWPSYDVFNGDADGICALQQLRLQTARAERITGLKRDIDLLQRVDADAGRRDHRARCVARQKSRRLAKRCWRKGASVFYADHHYAGEIPQHDSARVSYRRRRGYLYQPDCQRLLDGAQARWAVVGAFGDNFDRPARRTGRSIRACPSRTGLHYNSLESA